MDNGEKNYRYFLSGDNEGFEWIVLTYREGLTLYINSIVRNINAAEDLMEDTFVKLFVKKPTFNGKSSFKTWLYSIGRRMALDHIRRSSKSLEASNQIWHEISSDINLEQDYIRKEDKIMLYNAMESLKSDYNQILYLIYFENFTNTDSAIIMKKTDKQIRDLLYNAKKALKTELERRGFEYEGI